MSGAHENHLGNTFLVLTVWNKIFFKNLHKLLCLCFIIANYILHFHCNFISRSLKLGCDESLSGAQTLLRLDIIDGGVSLYWSNYQLSS